MTYPERLLDHYRAPRHRGPLADATHEHTHRNPLCGDVITMRLRVAGDVIAAAAFEGVGCVYCIAAASLVADHVIGHALADAAAVTPDQVVAWLDVPVPAGRRDCPEVPWRALQGALA